MGEQPLVYALASEQELNELVSGRVAAIGQPWPLRGRGLKQAPGVVGVLWKEPSQDGPVRPLALVVDTADQRRLFARFAQIRSDFSPLSAWCHILSPTLFMTLDSATREPDLLSMEAAWAGLIIAEAMVLSDRPVSQLKLTACLATQSFAIARTLALWPRISIGEVLSKYEALQRGMRASRPDDPGRSNFSPLWAVLAVLSTGYLNPPEPYKRIVDALMSLRRARKKKADEFKVLQNAFGLVMDKEFLSGLTLASPEERLKAFDTLVRIINEQRTAPELRVELTFLAGYLTTVAAGGSASLGLASKVSQSAPEIVGWAFLIGGLDEQITWSSGFDGLGRLVVRELMRSFRLDDATSADVSADEAHVLVDKQLVDPLVHLQLKQTRIASVALFPGVNVQVPFTEHVQEPRRSVDSKRSNQPAAAPRASAAEEALQAIANLLAPMILDKLQDVPSSLSRERDTRTRWSKRSQRKLPLDEDEQP